MSNFESDAVMLDKEERQDRSFFLKYILKKQFTEEKDTTEEVVTTSRTHWQCSTISAIIYAIF